MYPHARPRSHLRTRRIIKSARRHLEERRNFRPAAGSVFCAFDEEKMKIHEENENTRRKFSVETSFPRNETFYSIFLS